MLNRILAFIHAPKDLAETQAALLALSKANDEAIAENISLKYQLTCSQMAYERLRKQNEALYAQIQGTATGNSRLAMIVRWDGGGNNNGGQ